MARRKPQRQLPSELRLPQLLIQLPHPFHLIPCTRHQGFLIGLNHPSAETTADPEPRIDRQLLEPERSLRLNVGLAAVGGRRPLTVEWRGNGARRVGNRRPVSGEIQQRLQLGDPSLPGRRVPHAYPGY